MIKIECKIAVLIVAAAASLSGCGSVADKVSENIIESAVGDCTLGAAAVASVMASSSLAMMDPTQYDDAEYQQAVEDLKQYIPEELADELELWSMKTAEALAKVQAGDYEGSTAILESSEVKAAEETINAYFNEECALLNP